MGWVFLFLLIGWPVLEIAIFIQVGDWIGLIPTILLFLAAGAVGLWLLRAEGISLLMRAQAQMRDGIVPVREGFDALCLGLGGVLLILPGFATDILALALLLPPTRAFLRNLMIRSLARREQRPRPAQPGMIIDGEYEEVRPPRDVVRGPD